MYIDSLLNGLIVIPPIPEKYKNDSLSLLNEIGTKKFTEIINKFDSESLSKISLQDSSRMRRIWEVYQSTGKKYILSGGLNCLISSLYKPFSINKLNFTRKAPRLFLDPLI